MKLYEGYEKMDTIKERYSCAAGLHYANELIHKAREVHFQVRAPAKSDLEYA